ncbi:MAG TPA: DUF362 domain-containing protein [Bryobacteraceae bacterium]|nr:DUF362 domain-containing protein [Bryobacteraceae bacterium]
MRPASFPELSRSPLSRRRFIAATGSLAAVESCGRPAAPWPAVSIRRMNSYSGDLTGMLRDILAEHRMDVRGKRVVLKPNLVEFDQRTAINTHPALVHAAREAFLAAGAAEVRIAEGPGHRRVTLDLADAAGYFSTIHGFENLFTDLNLDELTAVALASPKSKLSSLYLPNTVLACDLLVSMPKLKTHHWAGATLSMKNLFGLVPGGVYGWPKNVLHWAGIHECIADLHGLFPRSFAIVDGIVGMEGNGPIQGTPRAAGVIVAGASRAAVDATCCRIMGLDPARIGYLDLVAGSDGLREERIPQIGERIDAVASRFAVLPELESLRLAAGAR